ncbi:trypsin-like peptidase domain-containing protein, partial [Allosphingosinicella sp.]|uniref:trypsin-like peptidase domain-containing protein n=1 Tax=Allosphingosinicella sp. TaxID=2823234 RepID=UPI002F20D6CC
GTAQPGGWMGTGFLVAPGLLLTNHHVLNSLDVARSATFQLNYRNRLDGSADTAEEFPLQPDRLFVTSAVAGGLDYTFVAIDPAVTEKYGFIPVDRRAYVVAPPAPGNIIQHPDGRYQEVVIHDNPVLRDTGILLHYLTDTEPGSSGGPVFDNRWRLIALHHAAKRNLDNLSAPGRPPSTYLNEGIKLSAIASDLESRRATGGGGQAERVLRAFGGINSATGYFGTLGRQSSEVGVEALVDKYRGTDQDVDIGSWNIEWFSNRYANKLDRVASVIADFNLDIWALIESSPEAAEKLVDRLDQEYGLKFDVAHSEPGAGTEKQSTSMIWNTSTIRRLEADWDDEIKTWLNVRSQNFSDDMLEAVHGKVFDRYPGLFRFQAIDTEFDFFTVPLHLKAMDEGALRREMASKILAAAVARMVDKGADRDWILVGDLNAEIASTNFAPLGKHGLVALSAEDEGNQSFTYLKAPYKSMIDHVYVSPTLAARHGPDSFFVVAADKTYPDYIKEISDHRPIVTRLTLGKAEELGPADLPESLSKALRELDPTWPFAHRPA